MALSFVIGLVSGTASAPAAPAPGSLEERCIASGTALPTEFRGFMFNHHPEKHREPRAGDHYQTVLETVAEYGGTIPRISEECAGHYRQSLFTKAQYMATKRPGRWLSIGRRWQRLGLETLQFYGEPPWLSSFSRFQGLQNENTFGRGCTVAGRVRFKLQVEDEANDAIVAIRYLTVPLQVDSWFEARCLGTFSIHESAGARRCGQVRGTRPFGRAAMWGVKVKRVPCSTAKPIAASALENPAFLEGSLLEQRLDGWRCFYGHRGAASCNRGSSHVFLVARGQIASRCEAPAQKRSKLSVAGVDCGAGEELVAALRAAPTSESDLERTVASGTWTCPGIRSLSDEDRMSSSYQCLSAGRIVSFEILDPKAARVVPVAPSSIPADVELPPAGALGFPRTPMLRFGYQKTRHGALVASLEADPALVGQRARLQIRAGTMKCEWTADPGEEGPRCGATHWRGRPRLRTIVLRASQTITFGPSRHKGNWAYEARITTKPFTLEGIPYTRAVAGGWAEVINDAANCDASPWCHPNQNRARRSG
jgi:hypothetical protein